MPQFRGVESWNNFCEVFNSMDHKPRDDNPDHKVYSLLDTSQESEFNFARWLFDPDSHKSGTRGAFSGLEAKQWFSNFVWGLVYLTFPSFA